MISNNELMLKTMKALFILIVFMGMGINVNAQYRPGEPCVVKGTGERGTYVATTKTESTTVTYANQSGNSYERNSNSSFGVSANAGYNSKATGGNAGVSASANYGSGSRNTSSHGTSATTSKTTSESWQSVRCEPNSPQAHNAEAATAVPNGYRW